MLRISKAGQRLYFHAESDKDYRYIKAISLSVGYEGALYGSTFGFRVDEKEILDESHEVHLLVFGDDTPPGEKMLFFSPLVPVHSSKVEGIYTDSGMQALLGWGGYGVGGGLIPAGERNILKSYVSGREIVKYTDMASSGSAFSGVTGTNGGAAGTMAYPYDVRVILLLSK
jgi:hypothetical protein